MDTKFTPGPWRWDAPRGVQMPSLLAADNTPVCSFGDSSTYYPTEGTPPDEADAHLIAAAPDLYAALAAFAARPTIDEIMAGKEPDEWLGASPERRLELMGERKRKNTEDILRARSALAKARGEA